MTWVTLVDGVTADADELMTDFYHVRQGSLLPRGGANFTPTGSAYDLGSSAYRWRKAYLAEFPASTTVSGDAVFNGVVVFSAPPSSGAFVFTTQQMVVSHVQSSGTTGAYKYGASWVYTATALNTVDHNNITGATLSSNQVTLPSGTYIVHGYATADANVRFILYDVTGARWLAGGQTIFTGIAHINHTQFTLATTSALELRAASSGVAAAINSVAPGFGDNEIWARLCMVKTA